MDDVDINFMVLRYFGRRRCVGVDRGDIIKSTIFAALCSNGVVDPLLTPMGLLFFKK